jgi:hypothetical protein
VGERDFLDSRLRGNDNPDYEQKESHRLGFYFTKLSPVPGNLHLAAWHRRQRSVDFIDSKTYHDTAANLLTAEFRGNPN